MMLTFQKEVAEVSFNFFWLFYHMIKLPEQNKKNIISLELRKVRGLVGCLIIQYIDLGSHKPARYSHDWHVPSLSLKSKPSEQ